jgi:hypothetical protein
MEYLGAANDNRASRAHDRMTDPETMRRIRQEMMNMAMTHGEPLPDPYVSVRNTAAIRADNRTRSTDMPMDELRRMLGLNNRPAPTPEPEPETTPDNEFTV